MQRTPTTTSEIQVCGHRGRHSPGTCPWAAYRCFGSGSWLAWAIAFCGYPFQALTKSWTHGAPTDI